ncbi:MAG: DUF192 domain-containing protein [Bryobacteraceae bacterium]
MTLRMLGCAAVAAVLCGCGERPVTMDEFRSTEILFPSGQKILAETMRTELELTRGMMFRDALANDRGMLFVHGRAGNWTYYMFQVKIPLDIVWMDADKRVVEIAPNTPPCASKSARECPVYGGKEKSQYVLELPGGGAARLGIRVGDTLRF